MVQCEKDSESGPIFSTLDCFNPSVQRQIDEVRNSNERWTEEWDDPNDKANCFIDTCKCADTGLFETAIQVKYPNRYFPMVIVEQYRCSKEAEKGHKKWLERLRQSHNQDFCDIFADDYRMM